MDRKDYRSAVAWSVWASTALIAFGCLYAMTASGQTYPDPKLTPGVVDPSVTVQKLCTPGYTASIRLVTTATKKTVMARYGLPWADHSLYEIDHFISLELGGKNDVMNLWPQRWKPEPGAREKDVVETWLHRQVCTGKITLAEAQAKIKFDWYIVYRGLKRLP